MSLRQRTSLTLRRGSNGDGGGGDSRLGRGLSSNTMTSRSTRHMEMYQFSENELNEMLEMFSHDDAMAGKTWSRRLVENVLMNFKFYNPWLGKKENSRPVPSLKKAWTYYEHITLARHLAGGETSNSDFSWERAEPGEKSKRTELYSPWRTPSFALSEWGIGVGLYFTTLRIMTLVMVVAGLINLPNIIYYNSSDYNGEGGQKDLPFTLRGSAICTNREWVVCADCQAADFAADRFATVVVDGADSTNITLVQEVLCEGAGFTQGLVNLASLLWLLLALCFITFTQRAGEIRYDEDKASPSDYTIHIRNPPANATDPQVWKDFFDQFAVRGVVFCTIALNNAPLLRQLIKRRILQNRLRLMLGVEGQDLDWDDAAQVQREVDAHVVAREMPDRSCCSDRLTSLLRLLRLAPPPAEDLWDKIQALTEEIRNVWMKKEYKPTSVFVTFETEEGQRAALSALRVGKVDLALNNTRAISPNTVFYGHVLDVREPDEPSAVRWLELQVSSWSKLARQCLNMAVTLGLIALSGFVVKRARDSIGPLFYSVLLSCVNFLIPNIVKLMMSVEAHTYETGWQASLYTKITLFRWVMTAILTQIITPFTSTLGDGPRDLLPTINNVLLAEMIIPGSLRLLDLMGNLRKHVLGPRSNSQEDMNLKFTGTLYNLGERYTDFTKVVFLCFFYSALNPNAFFIGAVILFIQYHVDKFCLMRLWTSAPFIGTQLAVFSRRYFFSGATVALSIVASFMYAQFPYDNVCKFEGAATGFAGVYNATLEDGNALTSVAVTANEEFHFCNQQLSPFGNRFQYPAVPSKQPHDGKWMESGQTDITFIYGWTSVAVLVGFLLVLFGVSAWRFFLSLFRGTYSPRGKDQKIDFSSVQEIFAYVPQVRLRNFPFPFLASDIDYIDQDLIGWNDPSGSYDRHNLIFDVPHPGLRRTKRMVGNTRHTASVADHPGFAEADLQTTESPPETTQDEEKPKPLFSIVQHWPPEWKRKEASARSQVQHAASARSQVQHAEDFPEETI